MTRRHAWLLAAVALAWLAVGMVMGWTVEPTGWAVAAPEAGPAITGVRPSAAANDLDAAIVISGTGFEALPQVYMDGVGLDEVGWLDGTRLEAVVPWGLLTGTYTMTVVNPGGEAGSLARAFTVTGGIDVWNAGMLYGGEVGEVAVNPGDPQTLYAGSETVGLFRSRDGGENWSFVFAPSARRVALDPVNPETLYWGDQLHRSDDEAATWTPLDVPGRVAYPHPEESGTVFFSYRMDDENAGLWKSEDHGDSWVDATAGLTDTRVSFLVYHPADADTLVVGTHHGNLFVSRDGGDSWTFASKPVESVNTLVFSPYPPHPLWVSDCCFCAPQHAYKSLDGDYTTWQVVLDQPLDSIAFPAPLGWGDTYSRTVYAATCWADAYRSADGGESWQAWGPGGEAGWGGISVDPQTPGTLYKASLRDGVYKTEDGGETWRVTNEGLTAMAPQQMAVDPHQAGRLYAAVNGWNGVFEGTRGGESWQFLPAESSADFGVCLAMDPFVPGRLYIGGREEVFRSDDGGHTWPISGTLPPPPACTESVQTLSPEVLLANPDEPGVLLAGSEVICNDFDVWLGAIYLSTDHGLHWTLIDTGHEIGPVSDMAYDGVVPGLVYAATFETGLYRSTNGGLNWERVGAGIPALDDIRSIAAEPSEPYRVFAQAGHPNAGVYVSENQGLDWSVVADWLWSEQLLCADEIPAALYAAHSIGLLRSTDGGQTWSRAAGVLGQVPVYSLATQREGERVFLYVGTTGGYVEPEPATLGLVQAGSPLVNAGVYRYTTLRRWASFLPLVVR